MNKKGGRKNSPLYVASRTGTFNKEISIATDIRQANHYHIIQNNQTVFRIFKLSEQWYIWYEKLGFRIKIKSFTQALQVVERELICVA